MPREPKDVQLRRAMCQRFVLAMDDLGMTAVDLAKALGYKNPSTLASVRRGAAFVDVEKLYRFAELAVASGKHVDLHWLITGHHWQERKK